MLNDIEPTLTKPKIAKSNLIYFLAGCYLYEELSLTRELGSGSFGVVFQARCPGTETSTIKFFSKVGIETKKVENFHQEIVISMNVDYENIVSIIHTDETDDIAFIEIEKYDRHIGELLINLERAQCEEVAQDAFRQMLDSVIYLHSNQIAHHNIKP
ncbi:kinase-like domain-containing protein [Jimgerdemannia flammicorona]|uniref:non-specific serine/threonine protein kinase n=1 Tax=Jimgerdemannia flammicorona TaxID=994334 RepID=A0A433D2P2_9FUNG|nr:kinase-like domain-containing protein [Jimgerdemannia flammicorona]